MIKLASFLWVRFQCLPTDALLQHLASYLGFSYLGRGVSLHGCSSKAQPLLSPWMRGISSPSPFLNTRKDSTNGHHQMVNTKIRLIIFFAAEDGETLSKARPGAKTRPGAVAQIISSFLQSSGLNWRKWGKSLGHSGRYDLNQITYDYIVEVMNRFKGLDLADRVPEELWTEVCNIVHNAVTKIIPKRKKCKKAK